MHKISCRHITAAIERSSLGIGISTSCRKYLRAYYSRQGVDSMRMNNKELNDVIASDFASARPLHRFKLRSKEIAEIRKSHDFVYIAAIRGRGTASAQYDIIVVQPTWKEAPEEVRKYRLKPGWGVE